MARKIEFMEILREVTPLNQGDCFMIFNRLKTGFDFPLHSHPEIELNLLFNAAGAQRIVGDNVEDMCGAELVIVGPNLPHGWFNNGKTFSGVTEVTLQFNPSLFEESFLQRNQMSSMRKLFEDVKRGVLFSPNVAYAMAGRLMALSETDTADFNSYLEFLGILNELANATDRRLLSSSAFQRDSVSSDSRRIERVFDYINQNYQNKVTLSDVAKIANMTEVAFSRYIKFHTGVNFIDSLNNVRLGHVCRLLIDTMMPVSEIAYACGFNNMANFNRIFLKKKGLTPTEFREVYLKQKKFI